MTDNEDIACEEFMLDDIALEVPVDQLNDPLRESLHDGRFERHERVLAQQLLHPNDRVLDLGAGTGAISVTAARVVGPEKLISVEANPHMLPVLRRNLARNLPALPDIRAGAIVGEDHHGETLDFWLADAFWSGSNVIERSEAQRIEVPALRFAPIAAAHKTSALIMDIEGAELEVLGEDLPESLRLIIVELHPMIYGDEILAQVLDGMSDRGWRHWSPGGEIGVRVFQRDSVWIRRKS